MGARYINKLQAELYMKLRVEKKLSQEAAAAKVDISVRSGRTIEKGQHHTSRGKKLIRSYKTRKSAIDNVWITDLEPMLAKNPDLQPKTLLLYLQRTYKDKDDNPIYTASIERTLQRKVAKWQALNGQSKEIFFPQAHIPGQQGMSDFTHIKNYTITINGESFKHMLYHFRLVYSKWSFVKVIQSGESMQALSEGLQEALFCLGGAPKEHRTDSLSAAFKNVSKETKDDLTNSYTELCNHYNMSPTRNNKGQKNENGAVESAHGHIKNRIAQELILRGSNDFASIIEYERWLQAIVASSNSRNCIDFNNERLFLQTLPKNKSCDFEIVSTKVSKLSIAIIKGMRYSIPSNFAGHTLTLHIFQQEIKAYLGSIAIFTLERKYKKQHNGHYVINYKHIIHALIKKPGAFRNCQYREEIFPSQSYKKVWLYLNKHENKNTASTIMLRLLKLAADYNCEEELANHTETIIANEQEINISELENKFNSSNSKLPKIATIQHDIISYDLLIKSTIPGDCYATT